MDAKEFKSPIRKLVRFFQRSRDGWKQKYMQVKRLCKKLSNQVRAVEKSRAHWKEVAHQQCQRTKQLERDLKKLKRAACPTA